MMKKTINKAKESNPISVKTQEASKIFEKEQSDLIKMNKDVENKPVINFNIPWTTNSILESKMKADEISKPVAIDFSEMPKVSKIEKK